jgi:predicted nucleotidyltransferase
MQSPAIGDVLFTKTQQKVLGLLYGRPNESFYLNEIVRLAGVGKGTVTRELERMEVSGLLTTKRVGNQIHFQANKDCPIYAELLGIVRKTFGVTDVLRTALTSIADQIELAFVYGSVAKAEDGPGSDIDLFLVGDELVYSEIMNLLAKAEKSLGRAINPSLYERSQIRKKLKDKNVFLRRILKQPKLWVKGSEDDIREIRKSG